MSSTAFFNRNDELKVAEQTLITSAPGRTSSVIFTADRSCGATSLLRHLRDNISAFNRTDPKASYLPVYLDCEDLSVDGFLKSFFYELRGQDEDLADQAINAIDLIGAPELKEKYFRSALTAIPYAGSALNEATKSRDTQISNAFQIRTSPNRVLQQTAETLSGFHAVLLIDNLEQIDSNQSEFLKQFQFYFTERPISVIGHCKSPLMTKKRVEMRTLFPDLKFVPLKPLATNVLLDIASEQNIAISENAMEEFSNSPHDIYDALEFIHQQDPNESQVVDAVTPLQNYILSVLRLWKHPVEAGRLLALIQKSDLLVTTSAIEVRNAIDDLVHRGDLNCSAVDETEFLSASSTGRHIGAKSYNPLESIAYANEIYRFICSEISGGETSGKIEDYALAFRLSLLTDRQASSHWATITLKEGFKLGRSEGFSDLFLDNIDPYADFDTFQFVLMAHLQQKQYTEMDRVFSGASLSFQSRPEAMIFYAISMNRQRLYTQSSAALSTIEKLRPAQPISAMLRGYSLINFYHGGRRSEASNLAKRTLDTTQSTLTDLYVARIAAGMVQPSHGLSILRGLMQRFSENNDEFGYYTTLANVGAYEHKTGETETGEENLTRAFDALLAFGTHHISHAALSLMTAKMSSEDLDASDRILRKLERAPEDRHYLTAGRMINAITHANAGDLQNSLARLEALEADVRETPTWNIKTRYFVNLALLRGAIGIYDDAAMRTLEEIPKFAPGRTDQRWSRAVKLVEAHAASKKIISRGVLRTHWMRSYYEYWWFAPFGILNRSDDLLTS